MVRNLIERAIFIRATMIGQELPDPALRAIATVAHEVAYRRGTVIAREGDDGDAILLVVEGAVEVARLGVPPAADATGDALGKVIGRFGANEVLGEIAVLGDRPRSASIIAVDDVTVLALHREDLRDAIALCPDLAFALFRVLIARVERADARLANAAETS